MNMVLEARDVPDKGTGPVHLHGCPSLQADAAEKDLGGTEEQDGKT